jgi:ribosome-associated toxin RatA of RatAB toxin-antitoxin module
MKELRGAASATAEAPIERCFELLRAVDAYPSWYPEVVKSVQVVERDAEGAPARVQTTLHLAQGPLARDFELLMSVTAQRPGMVELTRIPEEPGDDERFEVRWRLSAQSSTRIELELRADLSVPRFVPLGGIGDSVAQGFVAAAVRQLS